MKNHLLQFLLLILLAAAGQEAKATHLVGGDITYEKVGNLKYEVTLNYYFDCDGNSSALASDIPATIRYNSSCTFFAGSFKMDTINQTGTDIAPVCESSKSSCNGGSTKGIERYIFRDTVTLPRQCDDWVFSWSRSARNGAISTITTPGSDALYLEAELDNTNYPDNNSAKFTNNPVAFVCNNQDYVYNHGANDPDGDSLVYSLYTPKTSSFGTVNYLSGYSAQQPLVSSPPVSIDSNTGDITMHATQTDITVVGVKVEELDTAGNVKSTIIRDIQLIVDNCTSPNPPQLSGIDTSSSGSYDSTLNNFDTTVCPGEKVELKIHAEDQDANDSLYMSWNNGIPGGTFTVAGDSTNSPTGTFTWTPPNPSSGFGTQRNSFTVNVRDNNCPYYTNIARGYNVNVVPSLNVDIGDTAYVACDDSVKLTPTVTGGDSNYVYNWSTGDTTASIYVENPGDYALTVSDSGRCAITDSIKVLPGLNASYGIDAGNYSKTGCVNDSVQFNDSSVSQKAVLNDWEWQFGDGQSDTLQNPQHLYPDTGEYDATLIVSDTNGCYDTVTQNISIDSKPNADFRTTLNCNQDSSYFSDSSSLAKGTIIHWQWDFGDDSVSMDQNPAHVYQNGGNFSVQHVVETGGGCKDSVSKNININSKPSAGFNVVNACQGLQAQFYDTTDDKGDSIVQWNWDFDNGNTATKEHPKQTFVSASTYQVQLKTTSASGCKDSISKGITIQSKPQVSTINDTTICAGDSVVLSTTSGTGSYEVLWTANGQPFDSSQLSPKVAPDSTTTYTVEFTDTSKNCTVLDSVSISHQQITPVFSTSAPSCLNDSVYFSENASANPSGLDSFQWMLGDGTITSGDSIAHKYSTSGTFTVNLIVTTLKGCKDTGTQQISINPLPNVSFSLNDSAQCINDQLFQTTNNSTITNENLAYQWDFGNGDSATTNEPSVNYNDTGSYQIKLIATSDSGCIDSVSNGVTVNPKPKAGFTINDLNQCLSGNLFQFTDTSLPVSGSLTYNWDFGDGNTSAAKNPDHAYSAPGSYLVSLVEESNKGCFDTTQKSVTIDPMPVTDFEVPDSAQCVTGNAFNFNNLSTISSGSLSYTWDFGDGNSSNLENPVHNFTNAGSYTITLISTSNNGCKDTAYHQVTVHPKPSAKFTKDTIAQCLAENKFQFTNNSSITSGSLSHNWDFGDGNTSAAENPDHAYSAPGSYLVSLAEESKKKCFDTIQKPVTVDPMPVTNFDVPDSAQCVTGNAFNFNNLSTISSGSLSYSWDFGDGNNNNLENPVHNFTNAGTYNITLISTSNNGCKDTAYHQVTVHPKPSAKFAKDTIAQCLAGNRFQFTNNSSITSGSLSHHWSFGDGDTTALVSPSHTYPSSDTFKVKVITTSGKGCQDSTSDSVIVHPLPQVGFTNTTECIGDTTSFTDTSSISYGSFVSHHWDFGDDSSSSKTSPTHYYDSFGGYQTTLTLTSNYGCVDSFSDTVNVGSYPNVGFTPEITCTIDSTQFEDTSVVEHGYTDQWQWDFGDGKSASIKRPKHVYDSIASFNVQLITTTNFGCTDSANKNIVADPDPRTSFSIDDTAQCLTGNQFTFTNSSAITTGSMTYQWDFKDGDSSTLKDPTHKFDTSEVFAVSLIVTSDQGCKDTSVVNSFVQPLPEVDFSLVDTQQCFKNNAFQFQNLSTIDTGSMTYQWDFGDGNASTATNPVHTYSDTGFYKVQLVATSDYGCQDSFNYRVRVNPMPQTSYTINDDQQCLNVNSFQFTNNSTIDRGTMTHHWYFGDGDSVQQTDASHVYSAYDTFEVDLVAKSDSGCLDTTTQSVVVDPLPNPDFSFTYTCEEDTTLFADSTFIPHGNVNTWDWDFGDGKTSTVQNPDHLYDSAGNYTITLIPQSAQGCVDTTTKSIQVHHKPVAGFVIPANCEFDTSYFSDTSSIGNPDSLVSWDWSFGDGNSDTLQNPAHLYDTSGTFNASLIVQSDKGCQDTAQSNITIDPLPRVDFTINDSAQCRRGNAYQLTNNSTIASGGMSYTWDFGNGDTSNLKSPVQTYSNPGTYQIKLIVSSGKSCIDSTSKTIEVYPMPEAGFTVNDSAQCRKGNSFDFTDTSSISSGNYTHSWTFGDDSTSSQANPVHYYLDHDTFEVNLVTTSVNFGCKDSFQKSMLVYPMPVATFGIADTNQCLRSNEFKASNNSTIAWGTLSHQWDFGDGNMSTQVSPNHPYTDTGLYTIQLTSTSAFGCANQDSQKVQTQPMPDAQYAINDSTQCLEGNLFNYTNQSGISKGSLTYDWNFDDGNGSNAVNPNHTYGFQDSFDVELIATSNQNCKDTATRTMIAYPMPASDFSIADTNQCLSTNVVQPQNLSSIAYGTLSYNWNFGDGNTSLQKTQAHSYADTGLYQVNLVATSPQGCATSDSQEITIQSMPQVNFGINASNQCIAGNDFQFTNQSTIDDGSITGYTWHFGDGSSSTQNNPNHVYSHTDTFEVTLVATSNEGCIDSMSKNVFVAPMPKADFSVNDSSQCLSGNDFQFTNNAQIEWGTLGYDWQFNDGNQSALENPSHQYQNPGSFNVQLAVESGQGCKDTITQTMEANPMPQTKYTFDTACLGDTTRFDNLTTLSKGSIKTWQWDFDDGRSKTDQFPDHLYTLAGAYDVKLIATSDKGCKDSLTRKVEVGHIPAASFSFNGNCASDSIQFTDQTTIPGDSVVSWDWDFGDSEKATGQNPAHLYDNRGNYQVRLITTSDLGCNDTATESLEVAPSPQAGFVNDTVCLGKTTNFSDTSRIASGSIVARTWAFGDGDSSNQTNPGHQYRSPGDYHATLVILSDQGCKDSVKKQIHVGYQPQASFNVANNGCENMAMNFTNLSNAGNDSIVQYVWDFGIGNGSTGSSVTDPVHNYANPDNYKPQLVTITGYGCRDTAQESVTIHHKPQADFSHKNTCLDVKTSFSDQSSVAQGSLQNWEWDFSNGQTSNDQNPSTDYQFTGQYDIQLIVKTNQGCFDTTRQTITVDSAPSAAFTIQNRGQCLNQNQFSPKNNTQSSADTTTFEWRWSNGEGSTEIEPVYHFPNAGNYQISLIAGTNGCYDTATKAIEIYPNAATNFSVNDSVQCLPNNSFDLTNLTDTLGSSPVEYEWNFGDGNTTNQTNPVHSYEDKGVYNISLISTTGYGCKDTFVKPVTVEPNPVADFVFDTVCRGNVTTFEDRSSGNMGSITSWNYDFGDGTSNKPNPTHVFTEAGTQTVELEVVSDAGCRDEISKPVKVYGNPSAIAIENVTVVNNENVSVEWSEAPNNNPGTYVIERAKPGGNFEKIAEVPDEQLSYIDREAEINQTNYNYRIYLRDICGNKGPVSRVEGTSIFLEVHDGEGDPIVSWTGFWTWEVSHYTVQVFNQETGQYETLEGYEIVSSDSLNITHEGAKAEFEGPCYRVIAHKEGQPSVQSISNTGCLEGKMNIYVPNAFSPDGNGINEVFKVKGTYPVKFNLQIYNRWGEKVFETNSMEEGWDGTFEGQPAPQDEYIYQVTAEGADGQLELKQGTITLIR